MMLMEILISLKKHQLDDTENTQDRTNIDDSDRRSMLAIEDQCYRIRMVGNIKVNIKLDHGDFKSL